MNKKLSFSWIGIAVFALPMLCLLYTSTPTAGEYYLDDTPIHTLSQKERTDLRREKVSFVFQSFNLIPTMTAWENIEMCIRDRDPNSITAAVNNAVLCFILSPRHS